MFGEYLSNLRWKNQKWCLLDHSIWKWTNE